MWICIHQNIRPYQEELNCFDDLRSRKNNTLRTSERFISNITCLTFEVIHQKKTFKAFKADQLKAFSKINGIIWRFNIAKVHWWVGLFERLIHSTKRCMRKSVRNRTITNEEFSTVLVEIEGVLNRRPLTFVYEDDIEEPLTPIHLYCGYKILNPIT